MSTVGTTPIEHILDQLAACPIRARNTTEVPAITRHTHYQGRHRVTDDTPLYARAARWIATEWTKPRAWTTAVGQRLASSLSDDSAEKVYDFVTGETFREVARTISTTWRTLDRSAYGRIPKTWRHRLETRAAARRTSAEQQRNTEAWWAGRQADYAPAFGIHEPTQPLHVIKEKTNA